MISFSLGKEEEICESVPLSISITQFNRVYFGPRLIHHPSHIEISSVAFFVILLTNQLKNGSEHASHIVRRVVSLSRMIVSVSTPLYHWNYYQLIQNEQSFLKLIMKDSSNPIRGIHGDQTHHLWFTRSTPYHFSTTSEQLREERTVWWNSCTMHQPRIRWKRSISLLSFSKQSLMSSV